MKKSGVVLAIAMLSLAPSSFADDSDARQFVKMPDMMRQHMLGNMRDHLLAINEIQGFLGAGEFDKAADVAEKRIGMSSLSSHNAAHMAPYMPKQMQEMGLQMHKAASQFALAAQENSVNNDTQRAIGALSKITQQYVACHAAYRIH